MKNNNIDDKNVLPKSLLKFFICCILPGFWPQIIVWAILAMLVSFDSVLFPNYQKWLVSLLENDIPAEMTWLQYILPTIILIVALNMMITISALIKNTIASHWQNKIHNKISEVLTEYTQSQSLGFWAGRMPGKVNRQMDFIIEMPVVFNSLWLAICLILTIIINSGALFSVNLYVAIIFVFTFIFRVIFAWKMRKPIKQATQEKTDAWSSFAGKLMDSLSNYQIVKSFAGQKREKKYMVEPRKNLIEKRLKFAFLNRIFYGIPGILWDLLFGTTLFFCAMLYFRGEITIAKIVFTTSIYFQVMGAISQVINMLPDIIDKVGSANKAYSELVVPLDVYDNENAKSLKVTHGKIEFKNVSFKYRNKYILRDLSLTIKPGERIGIVGPSGAGKTTLVNLLMRFYDTNSGNILIDGQNIRNVTQESLRENISFIPQEPTMFNRTIAENIAYGREGANIHEIKQAAHFASADKFINSTEKKYDSYVGDRGIKLSGGQRQRIAIARAFLKNAPILILDEATSALDSETEIAIQSSFDKLSLGHTTIAIAHRLSTLRNMDKIIVLDKGKIIEAGSHNALLKKHGAYARLWKMQSGGFLQDS